MRANSANPAQSKSRRRPWLGPVAIAVLTIAGLALVESQADLDRNLRAWIETGLVLLGLIAQLGWLLFFSGLPWRARLAWLAFVVSLAAGLRLATRVDGALSGLGLPRFVWRWTPTRDQKLATTPLPTTHAQPSPIPRPASPFQFPQFLGPNRDGHAAPTRLERDWTQHPPRELWRRPIGLGWSGFVVSEDLAVTQEQRGDEELVSAYSLQTGEPAWSHATHARFREWQGGDGPRATPTIVGNKVYAFGATGWLNCLELNSGRLVWAVDVLASNQLANPTWGKSSSPLVAEGRVFVSGGTSERRSLLAYDANTGSQAWAADGEPASYASPAITLLAGRKQLLVIGTKTVAGHDPATGAKLWDFVWGSDKAPKCAQPLATGNDRIFLSAGYGMGCLLIEVKARPDGSFAATEVWKARTMKTQFNNAALRNGYLYGLDDGFLACVELATGRRMWKDGRYGSGQSLLVGDLVVIQAEQGFVALAEASPDRYRELGRIPALASKTWNNPAVAGPYLLVRNDQEAVCYELPSAHRASTGSPGSP